jgi:hypothetical protein
VRESISSSRHALALRRPPTSDEAVLGAAALAGIHHQRAFLAARPGSARRGRPGRLSRRSARTGGNRHGAARRRFRPASARSTAPASAGRCSAAARRSARRGNPRSGLGRGRADQHAVAARSVDQLHHQLLEIVEHVFQRLGLAAAKVSTLGSLASRPNRSGRSRACSYRSPCRRRCRCPARWQGDIAGA